MMPKSFHVAAQPLAIANGSFQQQGQGCGRGTLALWLWVQHPVLACTPWLHPPPLWLFVSA